MELHKFCEFFPPMPPEDFVDLVEDMRIRGQLAPIITYENKILDGRHRYQACLELGIDPRIEEYTGDDPLGLAGELWLGPLNRSGDRRGPGLFDIQQSILMRPSAPVDQHGVAFHTQAADPGNASSDIHDPETVPVIGLAVHVLERLADEFLFTGSNFGMFLV